jgi:hypothetical protein
MMQKCLGEQIGRNVQVYIDDVVITMKQEAILIDDLRETFDNLDRYRLKLNPTKCSIGVPAGQLLGFLVSARGIEASPEKIQAILTMKKPAKLRDIQQLAGRVEALRRFIARLGEGVTVLHIDEKIRQIRVERGSRKSFSKSEASTVDTTSAGSTQRKRATTLVHRRHTSGGKHRSHRRAKRRRQSSRCSAASLLP